MGGLIKNTNAKVFHYFCVLTIVISLVFLQEGLSYYLSFQVLAIFLLVSYLYTCQVYIRSIEFVFLLVFLFFISISVTAINAPTVISQNSSNITYTLISILVHASILLIMTSLKFGKAIPLLVFFKNISSLTLIVLIVLTLIGDFGVRGVDRDFLQLQNARLVTNFADIELLQKDLDLKHESNVSPRLDLFYGESSFLAIVVFSCLGCFLISTKLLKKFIYEDGYSQKNYKKFELCLVLAGIFLLLYIKSLSSMIYALVISGAFFTELLKTKVITLSMIGGLIVLIFIVALTTGSVDYVTYRVGSLGESVSLTQRFGAISNFGFTELMLGLANESLVPEHGFHNGIIYIIAISGFMGLSLMAFIIGTVFYLAKKLDFAALSTLLVLALFSQNGAVFSPNKIVLFGLICLPLCCVRNICEQNKT